MFIDELDNLIEQLQEISGVSKKQAIEIINFLLSKRNEEQDIRINNFLKDIKKIKECSICSLYTDNQDSKCNICLSNKRESKLMIIENRSQIQKYEDWGLYKGRYFKVPQLFTKKFERINSNFEMDFLIDYINQFDEVIIALSPTPEGVLTSNLIFDTIKKSKPNIYISQLAIGIPMNSQIDYVDKLTLSQALKNRKEIK